MESIDNLQLYTVADVARMTRVSKSYIQREINAGRLRAWKLGKGFKVSGTALEAWLASLPEVQPDRPATVL